MSFSFYSYGIIFLKTFIIELNIQEKFIEIPEGTDEYLFAKIKVQITEAKTGSLIELSVITFFSTGIQIKAGNLNISFVSSINHLAFTHPPTKIAHSGSNQSFQAFLNSSLTKYNISSYLAVAI